MALECDEEEDVHVEIVRCRIGDVGVVVQLRVDTLVHKSAHESNMHLNNVVGDVGVYLKHVDAIKDVVRNLVNIYIQNGRNV